MNAGTMIPAQMVREIHDLILTTEPGRAGERDGQRLDGVLARVELLVEYDEVDDVFEIAGLYGMAIATGHAFIDCNKRTALVTALTYLTMQGIDVPRHRLLEDAMVYVAEKRVDYKQLAALLYLLSLPQGVDELVEQVARPIDEN